jgi:NAD(P)-dependent dehydrogenase (short-subunit alcohol dehydrogenase family)
VRPRQANDESAGSGIADPQALLLHQYPTADWRAVLAVDLDGVFFCAREALRLSRLAAEDAHPAGDRFGSRAPVATSMTY